MKKLIGEMNIFKKKLHDLDEIKDADKEENNKLNYSVNKNLENSDDDDSF